MNIETIRIDKLSNDPANARKHPDRNIETIIASLRRFGQQKPIVIDKSGVVRAGNGTLEAAKQLGWETIQCVRTELQGSEATAYAIADNRTAELAEWDSEMLAATLESLAADDMLEDVGFSDEELEAILRGLNDGDESQESTTEEIDPDEFNLECQCPKCGFEFNPKT